MLHSTYNLKREVLKHRREVMQHASKMFEVMPKYVLMMQG